MAKVNYHTHTYRCQHAKGDVEDYIQYALANGLTTLGFSDHTPWVYEDGYISPIRMRVDQLDEYVQTINTAKIKYDGRIQIYSGLEVEYHPDKLPWLIDLATKHGLDYMILGNHSYPHDEYGSPQCHDFFAIHDIDDIHLYVDVLTKAVESDLFSCIAHPEVFMRGYRKLDETARLAFEQIITLAKKHDVVLEYNLNGLPFDHLYGIHTYPHPLFWEMAGKAGCKAIIGYDAHFPEAFEQWEDEYQKGMDLLKHCGCTIVDTIPLGKYKK